MKKTKLMLGDNIESLKKLPDNSVDSVVTDPPYGLSFMNKKWDYDVPSVEFWSEVYRVLKPGGHILSFGGTRTYHRMVVNIEDAGFEIRDQIQWIYGSGFPKSHNIGKAVDKLEGNDREETDYIAPDGNIRYGGNSFSVGKEPDGRGVNKKSKGTSPYEGWGTALKPANEPICVARKPLSEKSVAENVLKWGTGGINVDGCRVGSDTIKINGGGRKYEDGFNGGWNNISGENITNEGRFPANIILECICDEVIKGERGEMYVRPKVSGFRENFIGGGDVLNSGSLMGNYTDKGDIHTNPNCPCRLLDEQSGFLKGDNPNRKPRKGGHREQYVGTDNNEVKNVVIQPKAFDSGGASRFFYQAKVSKAERNMGLDGFEDKGKGWSNHLPSTTNGTSDVIYERSTTTKNTHPTVKPINLMAYLCRLITPEGGIVLDPFMGSGSTGVAAQLEGFRFLGMEMDKDYFEIAETRIDSYEKYNKFKK